MKLYVVYDRVAEESGPVFEAKNNGVAWRKYARMLNSEKDLVKYSDYMLLCVGKVDHDLNKVEGIFPAEEVIESVALVDEAQEES